MLIASLLDLPAPLITMYIIDDILVDKNINLLSLLCGALFIIICLRLFSGFIQRFILETIRQRVVLDVQINLFKHIHQLPHSFFEKYRTGYLMSRIREDVNASQGLFANTFLSMIRNVITLIVGMILIYIIHWKLALVSTFILPIFILSIMAFYKKLRHMSKEIQEKTALVSSNLQESLSAQYIVKSFSTEKLEQRKFFAVKKEAIRQIIKTFVFGSYAGMINGLIASSAPLIILWYGGMEIINGNLTLGQFVAFNSFLAYLFGPARSLFNINLSIQRSLGAVERIFEILDTPVLIKDNNKPFHLNIKGNIEFKNVHFSYDGSKKVLENIDLEIKEGETIGVIGPSGSGKTTLVNLIPRFYEPESGFIFIDGIDQKKISLHFLRKQIGIVHQDTFLFSSSILDNIKYGNRDASIEEVIKAAKLADAHEFIMELPEGYETELGERGLKLSGGQRQRIAIARAIIRNPRILILDEAVSWLDGKSEDQIKKSLKPFMRKCTTIIVSHRSSTIMDADRIVIIENGKIVGKGDPNSLNHKLYPFTKTYLAPFDDTQIQ
jgi:subfamily B ATP-binding cassette protein MsbA